MFTLTPELIAGPVSALAIAILGYTQLHKDNKALHADYLEVTKRLIGAFEEEIAGCNHRYEVLFNKYHELQQDVLALRREVTK